MIRAVVADDHALSRMRLVDLLKGIDDIECVGEAADGSSAVELIESVRPNVVFLDIRMPGLSGLEVVRRVEPCPLTIFTTAYDEHAVTAFELQALDYLLKPFGRERLELAVNRARTVLGQGAEVDQWERTVSAVRPEIPLQRVFVRVRGKIVPVRLSDVEHLESRGDYVALWEADRSHLLRATLERVLGRVDRRKFVRIHRSHAVNLDHVRAFSAHDASRLLVELKSGKRLVASRTRTVSLRKYLSS